MLLRASQPDFAKAVAAIMAFAQKGAAILVLLRDDLSFLESASGKGGSGGGSDGKSLKAVMAKQEKFFQNEAGLSFKPSGFR